jgi:hypothetical protein
MVKKRERAKFVPPLIRCGVEVPTIDDLIQLDRKHVELLLKTTLPLQLDGCLGSESPIRNAFEQVLQPFGTNIYWSSERKVE